MIEIKQVIELKLKHERKMLHKFINAKNITAKRAYEIRIRLLHEILKEAKANDLETSENGLHKHIVMKSVCPKCKCEETEKSNNNYWFCNECGWTWQTVL